MYVIFQLLCVCVCVYIYIYIYIGLVGRVFINGPRDLGSIPGRVIPKTLKTSRIRFLNKSTLS